MAFIRKVKTGSGATAVQIVRKSYGQIVSIKHLGSAHTDKELSILLSLAKDRLHAGQQALFPTPAKALKVGIKQTFSSLLFKVLKKQYDCLGFTGLNDEYFTYLSIARIVEPTSKLDSLRVLSDLGLRNLNENHGLKPMVSKQF